MGWVGWGSGAEGGGFGGAQLWLVALLLDILLASGMIRCTSVLPHEDGAAEASGQNLLAVLWHSIYIPSRLSRTPAQCLDDDVGSLGTSPPLYACESRVALTWV